MVRSIYGVLCVLAALLCGLSPGASAQVGSACTSSFGNYWLPGPAPCTTNITLQTQTGLTG
jgi:hypothetical protein